MNNKLGQVLGTKTIVCDHCQQEYTYQVKRGQQRRFCSDKCRYGWRAKHRPDSREARAKYKANRRARRPQVEMRKGGDRLPVAPLLSFADRAGVDIVLDIKVDHVNVFTADEIAVKVLKVHPAVIYGEDWFQA